MTTRSETNRTAVRTPRTPPFSGRYAALVAGRRSKWAVFVFWLLLIAVAGSLASKIGSVENNDAQTWLPASAQSTRGLAVAEQDFAGKDTSTARSGTPTSLEVEITGPAGDVADYIHIYTGLDTALLGGTLAIVALFLVALGVDYTVFLMTRAREEVQRCGHRDGILASVTLTGGVITSAGLVLAATFCVLAAIPTVGSLQEGLLIAVGVLLDTLLVRSLLVPALALDIGPRMWRPGRPESAGAHMTAPIMVSGDASQVGESLACHIS